MKINSRTREIIEKQFYLDCNLAEAEEIKAGEIYLSKSKKLPGTRIVSKTDLFFRAIMYGGKAYLMVDESIYDGCKEIFKDVEADWFCKFPNLRLIDNILQEYGYEMIEVIPNKTLGGYFVLLGNYGGGMRLGHSLSGHHRLSGWLGALAVTVGGTGVTFRSFGTVKRLL